MKCPNCRSTKTVKKGTRAGKQRYRCSKCGATFTKGIPYKPLPVYEKLNITCLRCGSSNVMRDGILPSGSQRYECRDCGLNFNDETNPLLFKKVEWKCPYCGGDLTQYTYSKSGLNRYVCRSCNRTCTGDKEGKPVSRILQAKKSKEGKSCPSCNSSNLKLAGQKEGRQRFICNDCGRSFLENPQVIVHTKAVEEKIIKLILQGSSIAEIVKDYNYKKDRIRRIMKTWYDSEVISKTQERDIIRYGIYFNVPVDYLAKYIKCSERKCKEVLGKYKKKLKI